MVAMIELPVQQNLHRDGILAVTTVPATDVAPALQQQAVDAARALAQSLGYVGVLCVEFFVVDDASADGTLVANEMAPRPHNSGHYSVDACDLSQFDLQVRTLVGAPLPRPHLHSAAVMLNLLGELWFDADWRRTRPALGARARVAGRAPAPVWKGRSAPGPQDGAPDRHRQRARGGARDRAAGGRVARAGAVLTGSARVLRCC